MTVTKDEILKDWEQNKMRKPKVASLKRPEIARLTISAVNEDDAAARWAEPIVIPCCTFAYQLSGTDARGVRLANGEAVQWDDLDDDGRISNADEIVWQSDFQAGEKKTFELILLDQPAD